MDREEFYNEFWSFLHRNKKEIIGALIGLIISILILQIGIFRTILISIFTLAGFLIGSRDDLEEDFKKIINRILPV